MASESSPTVDPPRQAGGGATESQRLIADLNENTLLHLRRSFESFAGRGKHWGQDHIKTFFQDLQQHPIPEELRSAQALDLSAFLRYMTSSHAAITTPRPPEDLSWPLASYFISSSHNTYLSGNQLSSNSTTDTYKNVLLRGCRCVEIDVWDGDQSDAESSASSSDEDVVKEEKEKTRKKQNRRSRLEMFKEKLPDSVTERLEKTSIGRKIDEKAAEKQGAEVAKKGQNTQGHKRSTSIVEPRVLHGYTLTKEIPFRAVCTTIRDHAFTASDLPVIVSLEVHCNADQQAVMVGIMKEAWKDYLVDEPKTEVKELPSPESLRRKILIKVKHAPQHPAPDQEPSEEEEEEPAKTGESAQQPQSPKKENKKKKKQPKIIHELSKLGIYTKAVSFKSFTQQESSMPSHVYSLSEKKFLDHHQNNRHALIEHNTHYLMRAYPAGFRITSSNLNPAVFWGSGTQIVALNWQQADEGIMLNEGMFAGTGGYVLKPEGYRPNLPSKASPNKIITKPLSLAITVLAAQNIPLPPETKSPKSFKPYIKVELHVDGFQPEASITNEGHETEGEYKTRTRTHKGCDVDFLGEKLEFPTLKGLVEELTFVRFTIRDNEIGRDELAAWACVRLDRLGHGYRFVHLIDTKGQLTEGAVLVKVDKGLA